MNISGNLSGKDPFCPYFKPGGEKYLGTAEKTFVVLLYSVLAIFATFGNALVCWVIFRVPRMRTPTNYLIANLALSDLLMAVFCIPFSYWHILVLQYWPFGEVLCPVITFMQPVAVLVSAHTLIVISIDRFLAIMRPLSHSWTTSHTIVIISSVWVLEMVLASPILVVQRQRPVVHPKTNVSQYQCMETWTGTYPLAYSLVLMTCQYFFPLLILLLSYGGIGIKLSITRVPGESTHTAEKSRRDSIVKLMFMMLVVSTSYTLCWLPQNIFNVIWTRCGSIANHPYILYIWWGCHFCAMIHSCVNPLVYYFSSPRFRDGYHMVFARICPTSCLLSLDFKSPYSSQRRANTLVGSMNKGRGSRDLFAKRYEPVRAKHSLPVTPVTPAVSYRSDTGEDLRIVSSKSLAAIIELDFDQQKPIRV